MPFNKLSNELSLTSLPTRGPNSWRLGEDLVYQDFANNLAVKAPKNMVTDLASIPRLFRNIVSNDDARVRRAAIIHDFIYRHKGLVPGFCYGGREYRHKWTRKQADTLFYKMLVVDGLSVTTARIMYYAVRIGGWTSWR